MKKKEMENFKKTIALTKKRGITLIALVVTIVVLLILAGITISLVLGENGVFQTAKDGKEKYESEQGKEIDGLNDINKSIKATTNKKPNIEVLRYSDRTENTMKITAMATDEDGKYLTYQLLVGETKENLSEQTEIKENVEKGTEVSWTVSVKDNTTKYFYKIIVLDEYTKIDSGIRETNSAPIFGEINLEKDWNEEKGNWITAKVVATDEEKEKLNYTFKMWKKENSISEEELVQQAPTKIAVKDNENQGEVVEITIDERTRRVSRLYLSSGCNRWK